jgi:CHAT domain-containing protein/tetratricopeptide (TPR) repeat protein
VPAAAQENANAAIQEIASLFQQGADALNRRDYRAAEQAFIAAHERARAIGDRYSMGATLDALGNVYTARGDTRRAIAVQTEGMGHLRTSGNLKGLGRALINLGISCRAAGQLERAIAALQESVGVWQQIGDEPARSAALLTLGDLYKDSGHLTKAIATLTESLHSREVTGAGPAALAGCLNDLGNAHRALGQLREARQDYDRALQLAQQAGDAGLAASVLNNRGLLLSDEGWYAEALTDHQRALKTREQGNDPEAIARSLANIGGVYHEQGRYDAALFYSRRALAIAENTGSKSLIAGQNVNLGISYDALGQQRKAIESLTRALDLYDEIGDDSAAANAAYNLGYVRYGQGDFEDAAALFQQALPTAQKIGDARWVAQTESALAMAEDRLGHPEAALERFLNAHRYFEKGANPPDLARSWDNLGTVYDRLKRKDDALAAYTQAVTLKERLGNPGATANAQSNLAAIYAEKGDWEKSASLLKEAIANAEAVRDRIAAPAEIGALQQATPLGDIYARYAAVLLHEGKPAEALAQVERGRGQGLARQAAQRKRPEWAALLAPNDARRLSDAAGTLRQAEAACRAADKRVASDTAAFDADSAHAARISADEARRVRDEAQQNLTALRNELAARVPAFRTLCGLDDPAPEAFTALAKAHPDTLYLTWAGGPGEQTLLFALRADTGVQAFTLPIGRETLGRQVDAWRDAITPQGEGGPAADTKTEAQRARGLYDTLFGPAEKAGLLSAPQTKRLVLIGDGPLREMPFAALLDGSGKRLVERFPLSTGISLRLLSPTPNATPAPVGRGLLCIADPGGGAARRTDSDLLSGFAPLPAARREGLAIVTLFGEGAATALVGDAATHDAVVPRLAKARLLHFATHGYLDDEDGLQSGLLIAPSAPLGGGADDLPDLPLLTAEEILEQPLSAELVVLSACETGRGEKGGGEGLLGLVWAFEAAGCPSVVASQWSVDDAATGTLMVRFYEGLKANKRRDEALRDAMLFVRGDGTGKTAAPYYWAPFQLHGAAGPLR